MSINSGSFASAGWGFYWDPHCLHPLKKNDTIPVKSNGTVDFYFGCVSSVVDSKIVKKDIKFSKFPIVLDLCHVNDLSVETNFIDIPISSSAVVNLEEIVVFKDEFNIEDIKNYQTSKTAAIHDTLGFVNTAAEAEAIGITDNFNFENEDLLTINKISEDGSLSVSSSIGFIPGVFSSQVILDSNSSAVASSSISNFNIAINTRMKVDLIDDFVLFEKKDFIRVEFDSGTRSLIIRMKKYFGKEDIVFRTEAISGVSSSTIDIAVVMYDNILTVLHDSDEILKVSLNVLVAGVRTYVRATDIIAASGCNDTRANIGGNVPLTGNVYKNYTPEHELLVENGYMPSFTYHTLLATGGNAQYNHNSFYYVRTHYQYIRDYTTYYYFYEPYTFIGLTFDFTLRSDKIYKLSVKFKTDLPDVIGNISPFLYIADNEEIVVNNIETEL